MFMGDKGGDGAGDLRFFSTSPILAKIACLVGVGSLWFNTRPKRNCISESILFVLVQLIEMKGDGPE